jgi:hypothetical protein
MRGGQQFANFFVSDLREAAILGSHGGETDWYRRADHLISIRLKFGASLLRSNRDGHNETFRRTRSNGPRCRSHGSTGGEAVIDENHHSTTNVRGETVTSKLRFAARDLNPLALDDSLNVLGRKVQGTNHRFIQDDQIPAGDCAHGKFFPPGNAELSND